MIAQNNASTAVLDHVGIVVPDLDQATHFFEEHFGATVAFRIDRPVGNQDAATSRLGAGPGNHFALAMLQWDDVRLELLQWWPELHSSKSGEHHPEPNAHGSAHVAFQVAEVHATIERLRTTPGVVVLSDAVTFDGGPTPGFTNAFLLTPWGLLVEILSWPNGDAPLQI